MHVRRTHKKKSPVVRILIVTALSIATLGVVSAAVAVGALYQVYQSYAAGYVPIEQKLRQANTGLTEIYDRNGVQLGALTNPDAQLLNPVALASMSRSVKEATISTEDNNFYNHPGFDWKGVLRAARANYVDGSLGSGSGGSSITQQLVKNVYICPNIVTSKEKVCVTAEKTVDRKLKELAYALELEQDYTKDQILEWYLNQISYADRYIGVQAAAQGYFHKDAIDLDLAEAAILAGIPQFPTRYHPRSVENCVQSGEGACALDELGRTTLAGESKKRQEAVLDLMLEHKRATPEEVAAAKAEPVKIYAQQNFIKAGAWIDNQVEPRLVRMCDAGILPKDPTATDCTAYIHAAGLKVTTTLDYDETTVAIATMRNWIEDGVGKGCNCYDAAIATIDPNSGEIVIYAPNTDSNSKDPRSRGDIDQLTEINQPGSSFKPIVYLNWFDKLGTSPMNTFWDTSPLTVEGTSITNPRNDGKSGEGLITARAGLGGSQNVAAFRAAQEGGVDNVIDTAKKMGITTLQQRFDPTFYSHPDVTYGASIATGGANIEAIDMAYMNSVLANMGVMVGVPHLAHVMTEAEVKALKSTALAEGLDYDLARSQAEQFSRGYLRLPGTRNLDPVVVLKVESITGEVLYDHAAANDLKREQVVNAGSVWLVHSVISDCTSRFIIWSCGGGNTDLALDPFMGTTRIPGGAKTGTQQGPKDAKDTLETWMNGYSRNAAVSVWVGNANNELVRDGPSANYASANTTVKLFKTWMGEYHSWLVRSGQISGLSAFDVIQPKNVAQIQFQSPTTERGLPGGCSQTVTAWVRTDVKQVSECETREIDTRNGLLASSQTPAAFRATRGFVKLPSFKTDLAIALARQRGIPIAPTEQSSGQSAVAIASPTNGKSISGSTPVVGSISLPNLQSWTLEIGEGAAPTKWTKIGGGTSNVTDQVLGTIDGTTLTPGVYTIRLTTDAGIGTSVTFNIQAKPSRSTTPGPGTPTGTPPPGATVTPQTPIPNR